MAHVNRASSEDPFARAWRCSVVASSAEKQEALNYVVMGDI